MEWEFLFIPLWESLLWESPPFYTFSFPLLPWPGGGPHWGLAGHCHTALATGPGHLQATVRLPPGHCQANSRPPPGHCRVTSRPLPGHCQATARQKLDHTLNVKSKHLRQGWKNEITYFANLLCSLLVGCFSDSHTQSLGEAKPSHLDSPD